MTATPSSTWVLMAAIVVVAIVLDIVLVGRRPHEVTTRQALWWSGLWLALGLGFTGAVWAVRGTEAAGEYLAGYLIERSLSADNVFVFALIFAYFGVPPAFRLRALLWGVLGAIVLRCLLIVGGVALIHEFRWMTYVFGAFLVLSGLRMAARPADEADPERNPVLRMVRRIVPATHEYDGHRMVSRSGDGHLQATPMLTVILVVAVADLVFALDSIPAIFAVTLDPFVIIAANVFALFGLRSLYFLLEGMMNRFAYLQAGLAVILVLVGAKMLAAGYVHVPVWASLAAITAVLGGAVALSLMRTRQDGTDTDA